MATSAIISRPTAIRAVLLDLSGTVHIGDKIIPGALDAIQKLIKNNIAIRFVTNTTKRSRKETMEDLWSMGFSRALVQNKTVITTTQAAKHVIRQHSLTPYCLVQQSLLEDLDMKSMPDKDSCDCVLVGLAPEAFVYNRMNEAFRVLMKEMDRRKRYNLEDASSKDLPPLIIALHRGKYLRDVDDGLSLGPGGFVACLQEAAGISDSGVAVIGKPSREIFCAAIPEGISLEETAMVGDGVWQDVIGAKQAGVGYGILVKTGKYTEGDESVTVNTVAPDAVVNSIVEAVDFILGRNGGTNA